MRGHGPQAARRLVDLRLQQRGEFRGHEPSPVVAQALSGGELFEDDELCVDQQRIRVDGLDVHAYAAHAAVRMHQQRIGLPGSPEPIDGFAPSAHGTA